MTRAPLVIALLAGIAHAEPATTAQQREVLSAILCIDIDAAQQAKEAIRQQRQNARASGGGVLDLEAIREQQEAYAYAKREEKQTRAHLRSLGVAPVACADVARAYNCINNRCEQIACEPELCDIPQFGRLRVVIGELRTGPEAVESSRLYTFQPIR